MTADVYQAWSVSMKNVQLCKQGIGSFIPGKYHEFLLGRFLEGNHLQGLPGIKLPIPCLQS